MTVTYDRYELIRTDISKTEIQGYEIGTSWINSREIIRPKLPKPRQTNQRFTRGEGRRKIQFLIQLRSTEGSSSQMRQLRRSMHQPVQLRHRNITIQPQLPQQGRPRHQPLQSIEINGTLHAVKNKRFQMCLSITLRKTRYPIHFLVANLNHAFH